MGAVSQADLTSDVTHLIAARIQTEKYRFAAKHRTDLKLMTVEWITAIHAVWMSGKDVNLPLSEVKYRLPIFHGLRICVTNLDTPKRTEIEQLVTRHGGSYTGDLTKENTHLIAGSATGKKWEAVKAWRCDICVVGVEWLLESINRGASLDEKHFTLDLDPTVRGHASWFLSRPLPSIDKYDSVEIIDDKRKRTDGQDRQRKKLMKRMSNTSTDGLWTEILVNQPDKSLAPFIPMLPAHEEVMPRDRHIELDIPSARYRESEEVNPELTTLEMLPEELTTGIFQHRTFYIAGFGQREDLIVRDTLVSNGGIIMEEEVDGSLYLTPQNGTIPEQRARSILVTEYWLERCLTSHSFQDPASHFSSTPFCASLPIARMDQVSICISGFSGVDVVHIEKLCKLAGAIFCDTLSKDRSLLLASSRECRKFQAAKEKGTRIVKVEWLWECIRRGRMIGISEFAIDGVEGSSCRIDGE